MEGLDWASILSVIGTATGFLMVGWKMAQGFEEKFEKRLNSALEAIQKEHKEEMNTIWNRFDERKKKVDEIIKENNDLNNKSFVRKEVYDLNHKHLQEAFRSQIEALSKLIDEKLNNMMAEIKLLRGTHDHSNH